MMTAAITIGSILLYTFSFFMTIRLAIAKRKSLALWLLLFVFAGPVATVILFALPDD